MAKKLYKHNTQTDGKMREMDVFVYSSNDAIWESIFILYVAYKKEFGEEPAPETVYMGVALGIWCNYQRLAFQAGILSNERIARLSDEGFVFGTLDHEARWEQNLGAYVAYKKEFGKEPATTTVYNGVNIGMWCDRQRRAFKKGVLSNERIARLSDKEFIFDALDRDARWEHNLEAYVAYKKEFGKEPVHSTVYKGISLGAWCNYQRLAFQAGILSNERIARLSDEGFVFGTLDHEARWEQNLGVYVAYKKEFGKEPATTTVYNGVNIGMWCDRQRRAFKTGSLSAERIKQLKAEGFVFGARKQKVGWELMSKAYVSYKKEFGKAPFQSTVYKGLNLGMWCNDQRKAYKMGSLSAERVKQLRDAGFTFAPLDAAWEQNLEAYVAYKKEFGEEPEKKAVYGEIKIGKWCNRQRRAFKTGSLSVERVKQLRGAGFVFGLLDAAWEQNLEAYAAYKKEFGKEPAQRTVYKEIKLGRWCDYQRQAFKTGSLSAERIEKLSNAGFPFESQK